MRSTSPDPAFGEPTSSREDGIRQWAARRTTVRYRVVPTIHEEVLREVVRISHPADVYGDRPLHVGAAVCVGGVSPLGPQVEPERPRAADLDRARSVGGDQDLARRH